MAAIFSWFSGPTANTATLRTAAAPQRSHHGVTAQHQGDDTFDFAEGDVKLRFGHPSTAVHCAPTSWGAYLRNFVHETEPIMLPFGSAEAHAALGTYFTNPRKWKEDVLPQLAREPKLLLDVLQYAAGLQSPGVFEEACGVFRAKFRGLSLPWPLDTEEKVKQCGNTLRTAFELDGQKAMTAPSKLKELVGYFAFHASAAGGGSLSVSSVNMLTHSVDVASLQRQQANATNDVDFRWLEKIDPFRQREWQPDSEATVCPVCLKSFVSGFDASLLTGVYPSHCRCCGRRVCVNCANFKVDKSIARLSKPGSPEEPQMRKACVDCYREGKKLQVYSLLGQAFVFSGLTIVEISMLRTVNSVWSWTAELILHGLRSSLYEFNTASGGVSQSLSTGDIVIVSSSAGSSATSRASPSNNPRNSQNDRALSATARSSSGTASPAAVASLQMLYRSSARLFVGHPEHIIALFLLLDWSKEDDVNTAVDVLSETLRPHHHLHHHAQSHAVSHWHLLCTKTCSQMNRGFFGVRMCDALQRAPGNHRQLNAALCLVKDHLLCIHHDRETRSALVPLLIDMLNRHVAACIAWEVLRFFSRDPITAMQIIWDKSSRIPGPDDAFYDATHFTETMEEAAIADAATYSAGGGGPRVNSARGEQTTPRDPGQLNKFRRTLTFLECLNSCMSGLQHDNVYDETIVRTRIVRMLFDHHLSLETALRTEDAANGSSLPDQVTVVELMYPFDRKITICSVVVSGIKVMSSKVRPVMIPMVDKAGHEHRILWKGECLRQDYVVCMAGALVQRVLRDKKLLMSAGGDTPVIPSYHVLPLTPTSGLIECVMKSKSIQDVIANNAELATDASSSVLLAVLTKCKAINPRYVGANFLQSSKFFILFNYLLKLRDRHRDNVMLTEDGSVFHIDFGMILNERTIAEAALPSYVRFDADLEQCIAHFMEAKSKHHHRDPTGLAAGENRYRSSNEGSQGSATDVNPYVGVFLQDVADWFVAVTPHAHNFYLLLSHLWQQKRAAQTSSGTSFASPGPIGGATMHNNHLASSAASPAAAGGSSSASASAFVLAAAHAIGSRADAVNDEAELRAILEDIFLRSLGEAATKKELVRRIVQSRGKEKMKDWTYETKKKTGNWLYEMGTRMLNAIPQSTPASLTGRNR